MSRLIGPPIECPLLPLKVAIPGGLKVGMIIRILGNIRHHAKRFEVNLARGPSPSGEPDLIFHFNPRFDIGYVARNTLINGVWGPEEGFTPSHIPFTRNEPFEIMILVEEYQYKVAVDNQHFLEYNHRVPFSEANILQVLGDLEVSKVEFLDTIMPLPTAVGFEGLAEDNECFLNPAMPFRQPIPCAMVPGRTIHVTARPNPFCTSFSINLEHERDFARNVCFHFNPRFAGRGGETKAVVVRNTCENGVWGQEERDTPIFPFNHGFNFDLMILCEVLNFLVAVNGQHLVSYKHRIPYEICNTLSIEGDVDLISVKIQ